MLNFGPDSVMESWLIVSRISALCFQRRHLIGLHVTIHRRNECSLLRAFCYTFIRINISRNSNSSDTSFYRLTRNLILQLCLRTRVLPSKACSY